MANWATVASLGDPSDPAWQQQNLAWIESPNGERWQVYKPAASAFQGLLADLEARGYTPKSSGGYNYRNIRGSDKLSQHAFGTAIDLNAMTNALGQSATDIPDAAGLAKKWGLEWGGNWKGRPDPMHFEYTGREGTAAAAAPTSLANAFGGIGVEPPPDTGLDMVAGGLGDLSGATQKRQAAARQRAAQGPQETQRAVSAVGAPQQTPTAPAATPGAPVGVLDEAGLADLFKVADIGGAALRPPGRKWF